MPGKKGMKRKKSTPNTARARMWQSMRVLRRFTAPDLARTAEAGMENVYRYLRRLDRHGFVRKTGPRSTGLPGIYQAYSLVRDTGPDHPVHCERCGQSITAKTCKEAS